MRYNSGAVFAGSPPQNRIVSKLECRMEYDVCTPLAKTWNKCFIWSLGHCELQCSAVFGAPVLPVRARCLMYTILSASLHPRFGSYLPG